MERVGRLRNSANGVIALTRNGGGGMGKGSCIMMGGGVLSVHVCYFCLSPILVSLNFDGVIR